MLVILTALAMIMPGYTASAVGYSTHENLTGCYAPGKCRMACGGLLNDYAFTVAVNRRLGLRCNQRVRICDRRCHNAIVKDVTLSGYDFELTYALALATGQTSRAWSDPHRIKWWPLAR
jgi:hypothetical protein